VEELREIQLIQTDELIDELMQRFDVSIFIGHKKSDKKRGAYVWHTKGDRFTLLGLVDYLREKTRCVAFGEDDD